MSAAASRGRPGAGTSTWIALFRGINVGGKSVLPMKALAALLEELGCRGVRTYIQSGNVVFASRRRGAAPLSRTIAKGVRDRFGFEPCVLLMGLDELEDAIAGNPFPDAECDPGRLHLGFLATVPTAPDLRSKLAAGAERALGVPMTDRNWRTVCKLRELPKALP